MRLEKLLLYASLGICSLMALVFLLDLVIGIPFGRSSIITDIMMILASGLVIWQCVETVRAK